MINLIIGATASGKTAKMYQVFKNRYEAGDKCCVYAGDGGYTVISKYENDGMPLVGRLEHPISGLQMCMEILEGIYDAYFIDDLILDHDALALLESITDKNHTDVYVTMRANVSKTESTTWPKGVQIIPISFIY